MESTSQKLQFPHPLVQVHTVKSVSDVARKKIQEAGKLGKSSPELDLLWQRCCDPGNPNIGTACVNALVNLVEDGLLDGNAVISTGVNFSSSARNLEWILQVIGKLLKLHILYYFQKSENCVYHCPFNLRSPPHPFILVLNARQDAWGPVCSQIESMINDTEAYDDSDYLLALINLLKPAILYVLLNPSSSGEFLLNKCLTFERLLKHSNLLMEGCKKDACAKLVDEIVWPALAHHDVTGHNIRFYDIMSKMFKDRKQEQNSQQTIIFLKLLNFCWKNVSSAHDRKSAVQSLAKMVYWLDEKILHLDLYIIAIAHVLNSYPFDILPSLLSLLMSLLHMRKKVQLTFTQISLQMLQVTILQLQLFSGTSFVNQKTKSCLQCLQKTITESLTSEPEKSSAFDSENSLSLDQFCLADSSICCLINFSNLLHKLLLQDHVQQIRWLKCVGQSICKNTMNSNDISQVALIHCTILLYNLNEASTSEVLPYVLSNMKHLAKNISHLSLSLLPILLHCLKIANSSTIKRDICFTLPCLASHPFCISPVLNILHSLAQDLLLKPLAIRLMMDVWKIQDRCYPHLNRMIVSYELGGFMKRQGNLDVYLMKAVAMNKICIDRPHQYGSDMLKMLIPIFNGPTGRTVESVRMTLALDCLFQLCQNEVLNIVTMWEELGQKLQAQNDGNITRQVLNILSLLPRFQVATPAFESFKENILKWVWKKSLNPDISTAGAALTCLSHYNSQDFKIRHLPEDLQPEKLEEEEEEAYLEKSVPGHCYIKLVQKLTHSNFKEYGFFISSLLKQELGNIPRDIHHRAMQSQRHAAQPKPLQDIPHFILNFYEKNKNPSLRTSLASALLLCHNPVPDVDPNGKAVPRSVISHGRNFLQLMRVLLKEVPLEPKNWQSILWKCHGWKVFMKRCLQSMTESRQAELRIQLQRVSKDKEEELDDIQQNLTNSRLWCREKIMTDLKNASKGNPVMQGNAVLALSGLLYAQKCHQGSKDRDGATVNSSDNVTEYLSPSHWTTMAVDTILSIVNPNHIPSGRIFSWCQYRSVSLTGRLSTTQLGNICAVHTLPTVAEIALGKYNVKIIEIMKFLLKKTSTEEEERDESSSLTFHCSICLGKLLSILYEENFNKVNSHEANALMSRSFTHLQNNMIKNQQESREELGSLIGFGLAFVAKLAQPNPTWQGKSIMKHLFGYLKDDDGESPQFTQVLCIVLGWIYLAGYANDVIGISEAKLLIDAFYNCVQENLHNTELAEALGTLFNGLFLSGAGEVIDQMNDLFEEWYTTITKDQIPTRQKLSALAGICALVGSNSNISPQAIQPTMLCMGQYQTKLGAVIKALKHLSRLSSDVGVPSRAINMLGQFYASFEATSLVLSSATPTSYNYLSHNSILRYIHNTMEQEGRSTDLSNSVMVELLLNCVSENSWKFRLPPVKWMLTLTPFLIGEYTTEVKNKAFQIVISQCNDSPTCASVLTTWLSLPKFRLLHSSTLMLFYCSLDKLVKCQTGMMMASFLEGSVGECINSLTTQNSPGLCKALLSGLKEALRISKSLASGIPDMLCNTVERFFIQLPLDCTNSSHLEAMWMLAQCMEILPDANQVVEKFEQEGAHKENVKALFIRCCCTVSGSHSLRMCNKTIDLCGRYKSIAKETLWICAVCFQGVSSAKTFENDKVNWIQEIMGKVKNLMSSKITSQTDVQLIRFLLDCFAVAILCWSSMGVTLGISGDYFHENVNFLEEMKMIETARRLYMPVALPHLLSSSCWMKMVQQITNWLTLMHKESQSTTEISDWRVIFSNTLQSLQHTKEHQKPSIWSKVLSSIHHL